jgi:hypothetical protein
MNENEMHIPFAGLVGACDPDTSVDNAVSVDHVDHLGKLFLEVALELFVADWQSVKQVLEPHTCPLLQHTS